MKILTCDDHELFRAGLRGVLGTLEPELGAAPELLEAGSGAEAYELLTRDADVELLLLDLGLPDASGLDLLRRVRREYPLVGVVVLSGSEDPGDVRAALDAGAQGFIPKTSNRDVLLSALRLVIAGGVYVPQEALAAAPAAPGLAVLTGRQREVLELMGKGLTNKEIAGVLGIAAGTVKVHVAAILEALEVSNRTEAVAALFARDDKGPA